MCGIVGFTTKNWRPDQERIQNATETLFHRGPDQQGVFRSKLCSLGATRLKIVDLASGNQPIYSEDRDSVIVFNGEIYNHLEIRRELESLGRTLSDPLRYRDRSPGLSGVGYRLLRAAARHVRRGDLEQYRATAGAGSRPALASSRSTSLNEAKTSFLPRN